MRGLVLIEIVFFLVSVLFFLGALFGSLFLYRSIGRVSHTDTPNDLMNRSIKIMACVFLGFVALICGLFVFLGVFSWAFP